MPKFDEILQQFNSIAVSHFVTFDQLSLLIDRIYETPNKKFEIYLGNLGLDAQTQLFRIDDLFMIITEIDYYEYLKNEVLKIKKQNQLNPQECQTLIAQIEANQTELRREHYLSNTYILEYIKNLKEEIKSLTDYDQVNQLQTTIASIRKQSQRRWKNYIKQLQKYQEFLNKQNAEHYILQQKQKWSNFSTEFQNDRFYKFNRLLECQKNQTKLQKEQIREELESKNKKFSKQLLDLKERHRHLINLKYYEQASQLQQQIDSLELKERQEIDKQINQQLKNKVKKIKQQQKTQLNAFMQKVNSEQTQHILHKRQDENRWVNMNKNILQDIGEKFNKEKILTFASRKQFNITTRTRIKSAYLNNYRLQQNNTSYNLNQTLDDN